MPYYLFNGLSKQCYKLLLNVAADHIHLVRYSYLYIHKLYEITVVIPFGVVRNFRMVRFSIPNQIYLLQYDPSLRYENNNNTWVLNFLSFFLFSTIAEKFEVLNFITELNLAQQICLLLGLLIHVGNVVSFIDESHITRHVAPVLSKKCSEA